VLPASTQSALRSLITGTLDHQFRVPAASLLIFRLRYQYSEEPSRLEALVREASVFFEKYESILAQDIARLTR
jgi:hypothetical protein